jgi:hypothetical protein
MDVTLAGARSETKSADQTGPVLVGWKEYADFPEWGIRRVKIKIDTGARTSALDVASYELRRVEGSHLVADLYLSVRRRQPQRVRVVRALVLRMVVVRNSSGFSEQRPLIETTVRLGSIIKRVQFTVTNRAGMRFPVIFGRKALEGDFIVNVGKKYLLKDS